ncbi:MAG: SDR family NAD(P)-dependent oxidoreductase [Clostridia bacterium]|nr:SDR family NAD(P)-dependent oxidoreductase [Clostridia bacterium]
MNYTKWLEKYGREICGKTVAVSGTTGGLGGELCRALAQLGANLILMDRNAERSKQVQEGLASQFPNISVERIPLNLSSLQSVKSAAAELSKRPVDVLVHNAGAYHLPRKKGDSGYDQVYQINFLAPYYFTRALLPRLKERGGRVVLVSSIAHRMAKIKQDDCDYSRCKRDMKVYGNAKRWCLTAHAKLLDGSVSLSVVHPGIAATNITSGYPKWVQRLVHYPMKWLFLSPKKACLNVVRGVAEETGAHTWVGPRVFGIWGMPKKKRLSTCRKEGLEFVFKTAEEACAQWEKEVKV